MGIFNFRKKMRERLEEVFSEEEDAPAARMEATDARSDGPAAPPAGGSPATPLMERATEFFGKLQQRADELAQEATESGQLIADADTDPFKRSFAQFKSGILAQFTAILQKGNQTFSSQIMPKAGFTEMAPLSELFSTWQQHVTDRMTGVFDNIQERDLEKEYADTQAEYAVAREQAHCKQCGAKLEIKQFYFMATYITCSYCQTQNTFDPGSKARMMEHLARPLAELRNKPLYDRYREERNRAGVKAAAPYYEAFAKGMAAEMDKILPGMEEQHRNFYRRMMHEYNNHGLAL